MIPSNAIEQPDIQPRLSSYSHRLVSATRFGLASRSTPFTHASAGSRRASLPRRVAIRNNSRLACATPVGPSQWRPQLYPPPSDVTVSCNGYSQFHEDSRVLTTDTSTCDRHDSAAPSLLCAFSVKGDLLIGSGDVPMCYGSSIGELRECATRASAFKPNVVSRDQACALIDTAGMLADVAVLIRSVLPGHRGESFPE